MSVAELFAASIETGRALDLAREADEWQESCDEGHSVYRDGARHCREASQALRRAAARIEGEAFRLSRAASELTARQATEDRTGSAA